MYFRMRRVVDTIIAGIMFILLLPIFILIGLAIKLDSEGPVIFQQDRIGKDFKKYKIYKFRTMVNNAQNMGTGVYSFSGDKRITRLGYVLRRTSLDELPQLWNIIKGDMAFVGPRSPVVGYFPKYENLNEAYKRRFSVLPGVTGLAQVMGRNELSWDEKVMYDNLYIDNVEKYGVLFDLKIWLMTLVTVVSMKDIEETKENMKRNNETLENNNNGEHI